MHWRRQGLVIISHDLKIVFLHVPKCAGTALRKVFQQELQPGSSVSFFDFAYSHVLRRYVDLAHLPLVDLRHFPEWRFLKRYQTIACVRNPYARLASACREYYRQFSRETQQQMLEEAPSAEQLNHYLAALPAAYEAHDLRYVHAFPITWFTHYGSKPMVDHVLRMENLECDLSSLSRKSVLPENLSRALLATVQRGDSRLSASLYYLERDPDLITMANLLHHEDFTVFDYARNHAQCVSNNLVEIVEQSRRPSPSHAVDHTSLAPSLRWYWGRSCHQSHPPMRPTRRSRSSS